MLRVKKKIKSDSASAIFTIQNKILKLVGKEALVDFTTKVLSIVIIVYSAIVLHCLLV